VWSSRSTNQNLLTISGYQPWEHWKEWFNPHEPGCRYLQSSGTITMNSLPFISNGGNDMLIVEVRRKRPIGHDHSPILKTGENTWKIVRVPSIEDGVEIFLRPPKESDVEETWNQVRSIQQIPFLEETAKFIIDDHLLECLPLFFFHKLLFDHVRPFVIQSSHHLPHSVIAYMKFVPGLFLLVISEEQSETYELVAKELSEKLKINCVLVSELPDTDILIPLVLYLFSSPAGRVEEEHDHYKLKQVKQKSKQTIFVVLRYGRNEFVFEEVKSRIQLLYADEGLVNCTFNKNNIMKIGALLSK